MFVVAYFGKMLLFRHMFAITNINVGITRGSAGHAPSRNPKDEAKVRGSDCNHLLGVALSENAL